MSSAGARDDAMSGRVLIRTRFFHTPRDPFQSADALVCEDDGALLVGDGRIVASGRFDVVRTQAEGAETLDWRDAYVLPGFVDTHVHFPQTRIIGSLGRSLLDWLEHTALPEEARMADITYATDTARQFVRALATHGTTTALVFGSHFPTATAALFEAADAAGLRIITGLVLSDRGLRPDLLLPPVNAYHESLALIERYCADAPTRYAVTPRFALSTSPAMLEVCQTIVRERGTFVQSHVNEQPDEIAACLVAFPWAQDYLAIYDRYALTGAKTVLAHNVHGTDAELHRLAATHTSVAHCPSSNAALGSGLFPMARHLKAGVRVALGTDVGAGTGFGMLKEALQAYLLQRVRTDGTPLTPAHLLYLATRAGADALGLDGIAGDFRPGTSADLVRVRPLPDSPLGLALARADSMSQALAAIITLGDAASIDDVWAGGVSVHPAHTTEPPAVQRRA